MSWIQQQSRRQQGAWVSAMPRRDPMVAGYAKPRGASCPLVGLVGACCSGCAEGKGCGAKEEIAHAHAIVGEAAIPWEDVAKTNATIEHVQESAAPLAAAPPGSPEAQRYALWSLFYTTWIVWYGAAKAGAEHDLANGLGAMFGFGGNMFIHGEQAETYKTLALQFNENLKALGALGVKAGADPVDSRSPAGKAFDALVKDVLGGGGAALGLLGTALTWIAIVGGVGLGLYFGAPIVLALIKRKK